MERSGLTEGRVGGEGGLCSGEQAEQTSHTSEEQEAQKCLSLEAAGKFRKQAGHRAQCSPLCPASCLKQAWFTLKCITIAHNFIPWVEKCPKGLEEMKASHRQHVLAAVHCKPGEQQGRMNT